MADAENDIQPSASAIDDSLYRHMVETMSDYAIFLLGPQGHVLTWNAGARRMKGYEAEEIIGRHFSTFYSPEQIERGWPGHELKMATEHGRFEDEGWRVRKDGSRFWANVILTRLDDPAGKLIGFTKITRDLAERRLQEELLRSSEERFRLLVESVKDYAIFMLDPGGYVMSWNIGAELNKGYRAAEIIGQHFSVFYPRDVAASGWPEQELRIALAEGRVEDEGWRVRKDGSRFWASVVITALYDAAGVHRGFAKVTRDLTDKQRVSALEDEGRRITNFLAMLGHELRNPLAPISNALSVLRMEALEPAQMQPLHEIIFRQVGQMSRLIDDLLDISRIVSGKVHLHCAPVDLRTAAEAAAESAMPLILQKAHALKVEIADAVWVHGDAARLVQIMVNLLTNAAKFTPRGGEIVLRVARSGDNAEIDVRDNGPGIAPDILPNIFELFFQGEQDPSRAQGGLGLGLSLVRELVNLHGGQISVFNLAHPQSGSEFIVQLPAIAPATARASAAPRALHGQRQRILVVDDNRDAADTMRLLLEALGYAAEVRYDGDAVLPAIEANRPGLVLLDIGLPGISGLDLAARIKAEIPDPPPLVALTGYGQERDRTASLRAGFHEHLVKPATLDELTALLGRVFG